MSGFVIITGLWSSLIPEFSDWTMQVKHLKNRKQILKKKTGYAHANEVAGNATVRSKKIAVHRCVGYCKINY